MLKLILSELKEHMPLTLLGAGAGIAFMAVFRDISHEHAHDLFHVFHPAHVLLSAIATTSMYEAHRGQPAGKLRHLLGLLLLGYAGAIGICTVSDSLVPYIGETLLGMPNRELHLCFTRHWGLLNLVAILGVAVAYARPSTKLSHLGHVLVSTWASLFHIMAAMEGEMSLAVYAGMFVCLFLAVWIPCCVSDIVFPLLFVRDKTEKGQRDEEMPPETV